MKNMKNIKEKESILRALERAQMELSLHPNSQFWTCFLFDNEEAKRVYLETFREEPAALWFGIQFGFYKSSVYFAEKYTIDALNNAKVTALMLLYHAYEDLKEE